MFRLQSLFSAGAKKDSGENAATVPDPKQSGAEPVKPPIPTPVATAEDVPPAKAPEVLTYPPAPPLAQPPPAAAPVVEASTTGGANGVAGPADTRITCAAAGNAVGAAAPESGGSAADPRKRWLNFRGDMMGWYFQVASIWGIPIRLHPFLMLLWTIDTLQGLQYGAVGAAYFCFIYGPALWFVVLVHELGHALTALACGYTVDSILLWPLGGLAFIGKSDRGTPQADLKVALAGPATHIPQFIVFATLAAVFGEISWRHTFNRHSFAGFWPAVCNGIMMIHVILFIFNLCFPCYPLDGGRALVAILLLRGVQVEKAARICIYSSFVVAIVWSIYAIIMVDVFVILLIVWIGFQVYSLWKVLQAGKIRDHPMFWNVPMDSPKAAATSSQNPLHMTPQRSDSVVCPSTATGFSNIFGDPKAPPPTATS